jgi:hypothetical protein
MQANLTSELYEATELIRETREQLAVVHNMLSGLPERLEDAKPLKLKKRIMTDKLNNHCDNIVNICSAYRDGKVLGHEYINQLIIAVNDIITEFEEK